MPLSMSKIPLNSLANENHLTILYIYGYSSVSLWLKSYFPQGLWPWKSLPLFFFSESDSKTKKYVDVLLKLLKSLMRAYEFYQIQKFDEH